MKTNRGFSWHIETIVGEVFPVKDEATGYRIMFSFINETGMIARLCNDNV